MAVVPSSSPREIQNFQFKLIGRLRIFSGLEEDFQGSYNLVSCASKYGLTFIGVSKGIQVISLPCIEEREYTNKSGEITDYLRSEIPLVSRPTHIAVNSDQSLLAVVVSKNECDHALIYILTSFLSKTVRLHVELRLSASPGSHVLELRWNPGVPNVFASCMSDGSVGVYELKASGVDIHILPPDVKAMCMCWSPKGKQLAVGSREGALTQYKPDLTPVKTFPPPPQIFRHPAALVGLLWVSNFQFIAVYCDAIDENERPAVVVVNAPKAGPVTYINYEDICCSYGDLRKPQFYLIHLSHWNVILVGSSNSIEIGVLGLGENQMWEQWCQEDAARAELPLTANKEETFPVGMALDTSSQMEIPWGENQTIPPMPALLLLSHHGVLCIFRTINLNEGAQKVCSPPEKFAVEKCLSLFTTTSSPSETQVPNLPGQQPQAKSSVGISPTTKLSESETQVLNLPAQQSQARYLPITPISESEPQVQNLSTRQSQGKPSSGIGTSSTPTPSQAQVLNPPAQQSQCHSSNKFGMTVRPITSPSIPQKRQEETLLTIQKMDQRLKLESSQAPSNSSDDTKMAFSSNTTAPSTTSASFQMLAAKPAAQISSPLVAPPATKPLAAMKVAVPKVDEKQLPKSNEVVPEPFVSSEVRSAQQEVHAFIHAAIMNEIQLFEFELSVVRETMKTTIYKAFTREELFSLRRKTNAMSEFCQELSETTQVQAQEVSYLITMQLEVFSWIENAKTQRQMQNDLYLLRLSRFYGLDPRTARLRDNIRCLTYYIETQLKLVNDTLDLQWAKMQEKLKGRVRNRFRVPRLEMALEIMQLHIKTFLKLAVDVKILKRRVEKLKASKKSAFVQNLKSIQSRPQPKGSRQMNILAGQLMQMCLSSNSVNVPNRDELAKVVLASKRLIIATKNEKLTPKKQSILRGLLLNRPANYERPVRRQITATKTPHIKIVPKEIPQANIIQNRPGDVQNVPGEVLGQSKTIFTKFEKEPAQIPSVVNAKQSSLPLFNITTTNVRSVPEVKPQQPDTSDVMAGAKPASKGFAAKVLSRTTVPTKFTPTASVSLTSGGLIGSGPKTTSLQSPASLFSPTTTAAAVSQSTTFPQFSITKGISSPGLPFTKFVTPASGSKTGLSLPAGVQEKKHTDHLEKPAGNQVFPDNLLKTSSAPVPPTGPSVETSPPKSLFAPLAANSGTTKENIFINNQGINSSIPSFLNFSSLQSSITPVSQTKTSSSGSSGMTKEMPVNTQVMSSAPLNFSFGSPSSAASITPFSQTKAPLVEPSGLSKEIFPPSTRKVDGGSKKSINDGLATTSSSMQPSVPAPIFGVVQTTAPFKSLETTKESASSTSSSVQTTVTTPILSGILTKVPSIEPLEVVKEKSNTSIQKQGLTPKIVNVFSLASANTPQSQVEMTTPKPPEVAKEESISVNQEKISLPPDLDLEAFSSITTISPERQTISPSVELPGARKEEIPSTNQDKLSSFNFGLLASAITPISEANNDSGFAKEVSSDRSEKTLAPDLEPVSSITTISFFPDNASDKSNGSETSSSSNSNISVVSMRTMSNSSISSVSMKTLSNSNISTASMQTLFTDTPDSDDASAPSITTPIKLSTSDVLGTAMSTSQSTFSAASATSTTTTTTTTQFSFGTSTTTSVSTSTPSATQGQGLIKAAVFGTAVTVATTAQSTFSVPATTSQSVFGSAKSTTLIFAATPTTASSTSLFGVPAKSTSTLFGSASTTPSVSSLFGSTNTSAPSLFQSYTNTMPAPSLFGSAKTTVPSLFASTTTTTSAPSLFGSTTQSTPSFFGSAATATTTQSFFGSASATSVPALFGTTVTSTAAATPSAFGASSPFGNTGSGGGSGTSLFGSTNSGSSTALFGSSSGSTSFFGQASATCSGSSIFGQSSSNTTATASPFGQSSSATTATSSPFGQNSSFGQSRGVEFGNKPVFGQPGSSAFGQSSRSAFGSSGGALFGGGDSADTLQSTGSSIFGGGSQPSSPTGPFSGGALGQTVSQTGFGSPPSFTNKPGGFGSPPVFGQSSPPAFGSSPTFGAKPVFGTSPTFGSPMGTFLSQSSAQQSPTFESLANQNTMTFGNLASSGGGSSTFGPNDAPFGSNNQQSTRSPFSNSPNFAGSSFSSWR